jgi:hypothetical protein
MQRAGHALLRVAVAPLHVLGKNGLHAREVKIDKPLQFSLQNTLCAEI